MFGKLKEYHTEGNRVFLEYEKEKIRPCVEAVADRIVNVFVDYTGEGHRTRAIEGELGMRLNAGTDASTKPVLTSVTWEESGVIIRTSKLTVIVGDDFAVDFYDDKGMPLSQAYRGGRKIGSQPSDASKELLKMEGHKAKDGTLNYLVQELRMLEKGDCIYGLGDKTGVLNKRDYEYEMWNSDIPDPHEDNFKCLYKSIPFFMILKERTCCGIFFDNHNRTFFDMGKECPDYCMFGAMEGNLDYYFLAGESMKEVLGNYTELTGRAPMQQLWTLGYHQSRWGYDSEEEIRGIAQKMVMHQIPCDCIHFDIDYMDQYKVFTWNKQSYEDGSKVIADFGKMGIKAVTIIDPGVKVEDGYYVYEEGVKEGFFAKTPEGKIYSNWVW